MTVAARSEIPTVPISDPERVITPRQLELLALYASGYSYVEIGRMKFLSQYTVRNTLALALRNMEGVRNLTHLCAILLDRGMIRKAAFQSGFEPVQDLRVAGE